MTGSTNKPGRKGKGRQYRMMRIRVDTWMRLATYAADRPAAVPCPDHAAPLESPDYCLACDLRLDRGILSLLRENEAVLPVEDGNVRRHIYHHKGSPGILFRPRNDAELKSAMDARGGGHCVCLCDRDWKGNRAHCRRCRRDTKTDTEYCQCCGDRVLDRLPSHISGDDIRRQKDQDIADINARNTHASDMSEEHSVTGKTTARAYHSYRKKRPD